MLNEAPKKEKKPKNYANPTKAQLFGRTLRECWRRAITPSLMYLFMSLLAFACTAINVFALRVVLGSFCIVGGAAFNAHLCYQFGKMHYDAYLTGCLHRRNQVFGIASGGDHRVEREYRPWKGLVIGFLVGVPVIVFALLTLAAPGVFEVALMMFTGYAIFPVQWLRVGLDWPWISALWSMAFVLLPMIVSTIFYFVGAWKEKQIKEQETERQDTIEELAQIKMEEERAQHEQSEEKRRKTLLSKKKK